jgi:cytochrome c biogenesis protein CcmG/thiol:disulfide interchange protein DsbE
MKKYLLSVLALSVVIFFAGCGNENKPEPLSNDAGAPGKAQTELAPSFKLTSTDNKTISLDDYKGKVVLLDFWATWCPPCRKGIPDLIELQKKYQGRLVVIGISVDQPDTKPEVVPFVQKMGINYPVVYSDGNVDMLYGGIEAIPTSFIIDKEGKVVKKTVGLESIDNYISVIETLL